MPREYVVSFAAAMARMKALSVFWCVAPLLPGFRTSRLMTRIFGGMFAVAALSCAATTVASNATAAAKHRQVPSNRFTTLFILCRPPRQRHLSGLLAWKGRTEIPARERVNWLGSAKAYSGRCTKSSEGTARERTILFFEQGVGFGEGHGALEER